ncbi:putative acetyltransferase [Listeria floridensis FSL S10-1187]|uniref:Acetyltransferase n=1 Tax=Listeria floridensis FSL S10-1187 TaxID=1265817 RepID=A0ABN0RI00_9LIST|nr:GNAT family N-acetyltransferase [Listeria floridensis]EUJ33554.1 putative acetyltransferase [Listeria floridensis FSL S10-1187]
MLDFESAREKDYPAILAIWDNSVSATHNFLKKEDKAALRQEIPHYFPMLTLFLWKWEGELVGFTGHHEENLEMFFLKPEFQGQGLGKQILARLIEEEGIRFVDVNKQNTAAYKFYEKSGFRLVSESKTDGEGRDYPILHLKREG